MGGIGVDVAVTVAEGAGVTVSVAVGVAEAGTDVKVEVEAAAGVRVTRISLLPHCGRVQAEKIKEQINKKARMRNAGVLGLLIGADYTVKKYCPDISFHCPGGLSSAIAWVIA